MSTLYERGERVRVRTITSEMEAVIVGEPHYDREGYSRELGWRARCKALDGRDLRGEMRILGRPS